MVDWRSGAPFHGMDEFVESIPFTETREYVQGIVRNEMIYRDLAAHRPASKAPARRPKHRQQTRRRGWSSAGFALLDQRCFQPNLYFAALIETESFLRRRTPSLPRVP